MNLPAHLANRPRRHNIAATASHLGGISPPFVSLNGGQFTLVDASGEGLPLRSVTLDCVIVDSLEKISRVFWGVDEQNRVKVPDPGNPQPPVCFSDNGVGASSNAQQPQSASCMGCRWNEWAWPAVGGGTKPACTSTQKIALYVAQAPSHPWLLRIPVTSHKALAAYFNQFRGKDFDVKDLWTRIGIQPQGVGYTLTFEPAFKYDQSKGYVDESIIALCDGWESQQLADQLIGRGDPVWTGQPRAAAALQAPAQTEALPPPPPAPAAQPAAFQMPPAPPMMTPSLLPNQLPATQAQFQPPPPMAQIPPQPQDPTALQQQPAAPRRRGGRQPAQQPQAAPPAANGPRPAPFGIASGPAAPPPSDMEAALAQAFGLPPKG